jgi:hypothetical protein
MKKIIIIVLIVFSIKANSQVTVNLTAGKTSFSPVLQGEIQYVNPESRWIVQGVLGSHLDREDPAFIGLRYGYNFRLNQNNDLFIQPLFGYHLVWVNFHNTPNNYFDVGYGAAIVYKHFKFEMYNINKYEFVGIGITGLTTKHLKVLIVY